MRGFDTPSDIKEENKSNDLVEQTHEKGKPWDMVYKNGLGDREVIEFSLIIKEECE